MCEAISVIIASFKFFIFSFCRTMVHPLCVLELADKACLPEDVSSHSWDMDISEISLGAWPCSALNINSKVVKLI